MTTMTTRRQVIEKLDDYLHHRTSLAELVEWAEQVMMEGDFPDSEYAVLRDVVARLGVSDVRAFGLSWEDCEQLVAQLGYRAEVTITPADDAG